LKLPGKKKGGGVGEEAVGEKRTFWAMGGDEKGKKKKGLPGKKKSDANRKGRAHR